MNRPITTSFMLMSVDGKLRQKNGKRNRSKKHNKSEGI